MTRSLNILLACFLSSTVLTFGQQTQQPAVVTPGKDGTPPSDAIVIFDKETLQKFEGVEGGAAQWTVEGNYFTVNPGAGNILTKEHFGDIQLHIEWRTPPEDADKEGQKSGNSGIYLMGKYEIQVLNSFRNETYPDGQAGAVYRQHPPLVNASQKPGEWQQYDIVFYAPKYNTDSTVEKAGRITVFHNGVLVQHYAEISNPTIAHNEQLSLTAPKGPLMLQDHNNKVSYRNIWIREL